MATPTRRSARVTKAPERLAAPAATPGATTPRKRAKQPAGAASAFASPLSSRAKRQKTATRGRQQNARRAVADDDDDDDDDNESDGEESDQDEDADESQNDSSSSSADDDDDGDSDFGQREGAGRSRGTKQTPRKAAAPKGKQARAAKPRAQHGSSTAAASNAQPSLLLNAILDEQMAVSQVVVDWIASYRRSSETDSATTELINFLIRLSGCPGQITSGDLYEVEQIESVLGTLQAQAIAALKRGGGDGEADGDDMLMGR
ncbi:hypothetical protein IW150_006986, partial [Coemansia sp. RSA 2607]